MTDLPPYFGEVAEDHRRQNRRRAAGNGRASREFDERIYVEEATPAPSRKFTLEKFDKIQLSSAGEWLIKKLVPRTGTGILFGESQSFKTFAAIDLSMHVSIGRDWAGRRVTQAPVVYIAAEGAQGLRKRKIGFERSHDNLPSDIPFYLISAAPNLGVGQDDLRALIADIEACGIKPGLIVIDTLSKSLGGGDENGSGMLQLLANMEALASHFSAFVLAVHHVGLGDNNRERGHSSTQGGTDLRILCERKDKELSMILRWQKLKDEDCDVCLRGDVGRVVIGQDDEGDEISTLIVQSVADAEEAPTRQSSSKNVPASQRLFMETVFQSIDEAGELFRPFTDGPLVKAVPDEIIRERYYARIAEKPKEGDTPKKLADRQRQAFNTAIKKNLDAKRIVAGPKNGERVIWLP